MSFVCIANNYVNCEITQNIRVTCLRYSCLCNVDNVDWFGISCIVKFQDSVAQKSTQTVVNFFFFKSEVTGPSLTKQREKIMKRTFVVNDFHTVIEFC